MTSLDSYLNLCTQVYDLSKPTPPSDAYAFYRSYVLSAKGNILEPMCGTGRYLLPFVAEGFNVHGCDASKHMLDALYMKAKIKNLKINVWHEWVEDLKTQEKYQLIFIPSGSFGLITDLQKAKNTLKTFYNLLSDKGRLVFEVETLKAISMQVGVWRGAMYSREDGKFILANFLDLPLKNHIGSSICRYELVEGNAILETEIEIIKVRLYEPKNLCDTLTEVGFTEIKMVKAFNHNKSPDPDDEVIVYQCRK